MLVAPALSPKVYAFVDWPLIKRISNPIDTLPHVIYLTEQPVIGSTDQRRAFLEFRHLHDAFVHGVKHPSLVRATPASFAAELEQQRRSCATTPVGPRLPLK